VTGCKSSNCSLVPGLTTVVPAVCPWRACRAVCGGADGWMSLVFTATRRPFTSSDASSTTSGPDLRGLAREDVIFPNALVPAFKTTFPLTETFCASFASKLLPTTVCELIRLTVVTVNVVPAGIVAAFKDAAAKKAQQVAINKISFFRVILVLAVIVECFQGGKFRMTDERFKRT